jgi:polyadenylate-binding protein 2
LRVWTITFVLNNYLKHFTFYFVQEEELARLKAELADMEAEENPGNTNMEEEQGADKDTGSGKEEIDGRSVYVGNVDYSCTPEELQAHFQECGTVNRVTILTDKLGNPKGYAYVEFLEADAVEAACLLEDTELKGRKIKVQPKRTNVPGLKQRGRGRGRGRMGYGMMPMMAMMNPYMAMGYGMPMSRGRGGRRGRGRGGRGGFSPY